MTGWERDENTEHRELSRLNATEHERERMIEDAERAMFAEAERQYRPRNEEHARRRRRLMHEWDADQAARAMDEARGVVQGVPNQTGNRAL
jgi:predicted phage gp36 major capsid-like protein